MAGTFRELERVARRWSARTEDTEDIVQESLLTAHAAGRGDLDVLANRRWIAAVIRNKAKLAARSAVRRRAREDQWRAVQPSSDAGEPVSVASLLSRLPPALTSVARLALSGLDRREIGHLLGLTDEALRKRVSSLRKRLGALGAALPEPGQALTLELAYGRIREALLPILLRRRGHFATHDPDGHLLIVRRT